MSETIYLVAGGVGLLIVGLGLGFWAAQLRAGKQVAKAENVQMQFDDYRNNVTEHFSRTAEHFQAIGQQYRELYEHMASGADSLCDREATDAKLSFRPTALIEPLVDEVTAAADPAPVPRDYADGDESADVKTPVEEALAVNDALAAERESGTAEPTADQVEEVETAANPEDGAGKSRRIYH